MFLFYIELNNGKWQNDFWKFELLDFEKSLIKITILGSSK
jgi:hypothetical protein